MMAHSSQTRIINATDTLIIKLREQSGRIFTLDTEQKPRTTEDVQEMIDGLTDRDTILAVWRVETNENGTPIIVDDISGMFDIRSIEEIVEDSKRAREREFEAPAFRQPYTTLNHQQQGIGR
jgi:hypothetical protein